MRGIECRGRCCTSGRWIFGHYVEHKARQSCPVDDDYGPDDILHDIFISEYADWNMPRQLKGIKVHPKTVGEYTGLKDKNGVKIFEGDILHDEDKTLGIVEFNKGRFVGDFDGRTYYSELYFDAEKSEVIGNIHDNPELRRE